jgi:glc operon protein GlcG
MTTPTLLVLSFAVGSLAVGAAARAAAQAPASPPPVRPPYATPLTLTEARTVAAAAESEARKNGWRMAIAVVEPTGDLVLFEKLEDTQYGSIQVSQAKARSAALFRRRTKEFADQVQAGMPNVMSIPGAIAIDGGVPILIGGKIAGAIGVSGGTPDQDAQAALAGVAAVK